MKKGAPAFKFERKEKAVESPAEQETEVSESKIGVVVNSHFVSVREYASDTAPVKGYVTEGDKVDIVANVAKGFYLIRFGRLKNLGFVSRNCIRRC